MDRDTRKIIAFIIANRTTYALKRMFNVIKHKLKNITNVYTDKWHSYREYFISKNFPNVTLIQSKKYTHLIESSNNQQRRLTHKTTRKTVCTTQSLKHLNMLLFLFYYIRTNRNGKQLGMNL